MPLSPEVSDQQEDNYFWIGLLMICCLSPATLVFYFWNDVERLGLLASTARGAHVVLNEVTK